MRFASRRAVGRLSRLTVLILLSTLVIGIGTVSGAEDLKLKAERDADGTVRLTWKFSEDPALHHYNVYWDTEEFDSVAGMEIKAAVRGNTFSPDDLENDVRHYFAVTAVDDNTTILGDGFADITPREPHLKIVNYWNLMALFWLVAIIFFYVIWKIPTWTKEHQGGA